MLTRQKNVRTRSGVRLPLEQKKWKPNKLLQKSVYKRVFVKKNQPATDQPAADQPAADQPAANQPATDQPATDQPAADQPAADQPSEDQPAAAELIYLLPLDDTQDASIVVYPTAGVLFPNTTHLFLSDDEEVPAGPPAIDESDLDEDIDQLIRLQQEILNKEYPPIKCGICLDNTAEQFPCETHDLTHAACFGCLEEWVGVNLNSFFIKCPLDNCSHYMKDVHHYMSPDEFLEWRTWIYDMSSERPPAYLTEIKALMATEPMLNLKLCPNCATPISKNEGCDMMTCSVCYFNFPF